MKIINLLLLRSVGGLGFLRQGIGLNRGSDLNGAVTVGDGRKGISEGRPKGQSECGVGVHDAR